MPRQLITIPRNLSAAITCVLYVDAAGGSRVVDLSEALPPRRPASHPSRCSTTPASPAGPSRPVPPPPGEVRIPRPCPQLVQRHRHAPRKRDQPLSDQDTTGVQKVCWIRWCRNQHTGGIHCLQRPPGRAGRLGWSQGRGRYGGRGARSVVCPRPGTGTNTQSDSYAGGPTSPSMTSRSSSVELRPQSQRSAAPIDPNRFTYGSRIMPFGDRHILPVGIRAYHVSKAARFSARSSSVHRFAIRDSPTPAPRPPPAATRTATPARPSRPSPTRRPSVESRNPQR